VDDAPATLLGSVHAHHYKVLGDLYKKEKKTDAAIKSYKKYLEKNSDNALAKQTGEHAFKANNYAEAIKYLGMITGADASSVPVLKMYGEACFQAKDDFKAYQIYKQIGEKSPSDADVFEKLYQIAGKAGTKDEVLTYLKKYTVLKPADVEAQRVLGDMLYEKKDSSGALAAYRAVLKGDPQAKGFYKKYFELLIASGAKDEEIVTALNGGIASGEADVGMYVRLAGIYTKQGNHVKAVQMYEKASQLDTKNVDLLSSLAQSQANSGNVNGAILTYEQTVAMNPQASKEYKILGDLYKKQTKLESAMKSYKKYLEKNSDNALAKEVGEYSYNAKNYAETIKYLAMVTGADASSVPLLKMYGEACSNAKDDVKAYQIYKQLVERVPTDAVVVQRAYEIAKKAGTKDDVLSYLKKYTALKSGDAEAQVDLGNILYERKETSGAIAAYKAALKANPASKGFFKKYAELVMANGTEDEITAVLSGAMNAGEADVKMYVRMGGIYRKQRNFTKAVTMYEKASQMDPKNGTLLIDLADALAKSGNLSAAVMTYEQAVAMNPKATLEYKALGDLYMQQKKTDPAIKNYKVYLEKTEDNSVAKLIGESAFNQKNYPEAVKYYAMVTGKDATDSAHLLKFATACFNAKDEFRAFQLYKQLSTLTPKNPEVFEKLYTIASRTGTKDEVLNYLTKLTELKPSDANAQKSLGNMLFERKNEPAALAAYRAALKADPNIKGFYRQYASLVIGSGQEAEKIIALNGAIAAGEADSKMYEALASIYFKQNQIDKAIQNYEKAAQLEPKNPRLLSSLAECQLKKGSVSEAIMTLEQVLTINPQADKEYKMLGDLYLSQKKTEPAIRSYKKYLEKNPSDNSVALVVGTEAFKVKNNQDAVKYLAMVTGPETKKATYLQNYGDAAFAVQDNPRALKAYKELAIINPKDVEVLKTLYEISLKSGASEDALSYLRKYTVLKPIDADAQKSLGDILFDKKDNQGALLAYQAALKSNPAIKGFYKKYIQLVLESGKPLEKMSALNGAIAAGEADANVYATLGNMYIASANYPKAIEMLNKASQLDPKNVSLLSSLADCQIKTGALKEAALTLEQALAMNPAAVKEYKLLGDLYLRQKKTDAAISAYKKYLDKSPTDYAIAKIVGKAAFGAKDYSGAFKYFSMVKDDETPQFLLDYSISAINLKDYRNAIVILEKLRAIKGTFPSKDVAYKSLADAYEKSGDQKKAAEVLNQYVKIPGVKDPDASYKRAEVYESINAVEAVSMYKENIITYPKDHRSFLKLGIYYSRQKDGVLNAVKYLEKVTVIADTISRVWLELGNLYGRVKRDQDMLKAYQKFLEVDPENADAIGKIGEILMGKKMINDAMVFLEMANALKENDPKLMTLLARGYIMTKRRNEGAALLEKVVKISKGNVDDDLRMVLIDVYLESSQFAKAIDELKIVMNTKKDKEIMLKYARALYEISKYSDAITIIEEIKAKDPENIEAQMLMGKIKTAQKKYDDAIETYKEILYIDQNYAPALCERANIYLIQGKHQWAQTFYERALKAEPKNALVHLGLAKVAKHQKDYATYTDHLEKARKLDPQNREILEELKTVKK
jgi:tetratricopeptide (TPR) repeat protein